MPPFEELFDDLLVGFLNDSGGINTFAVDVKAAEAPPAKAIRISQQKFRRLANSNVPGLLLVVDVKSNGMYYAWPSTDRARGRLAPGHGRC